MMIYLFHNIYGDADDLIASKPNECEVIPFGWTPEAEAYRNQKIAELQVSVSALPSVVYWQNEYTITIVNTTSEETTTINVPSAWTVINVYAMEQPWNWNAIETEILRDKNSTKYVHEE